MTGDTDLTSAFDDAVESLPESVDRAAVRRMRTVAVAMDDLVRIPGTDFKIGLDPVLGVIPGAGDVASGAVSLYVVLESARLGVSYTTLLRMLANVAIDVGVGSLPYVGDVFDAVWKSNKRNLQLALDDLTGGAVALDDGADFDAADEESGAVTIEVE